MLIAVTAALEKHRVIARDFTNSIRYSPLLPSYLFLPSSSFPTEVEAILIRHLAGGADAQNNEDANRQKAFYANSRAVFFDCRANHHRHGMRMFDRISRRLELLPDNGDHPTEPLRFLPIYQILRFGYRDGLGEKKVSIQARSTSPGVSYHDYDDNGGFHHAQPEVWLGADIIKLAEKPTTSGTWVPYVRNLLGLSDLDMTGEPATITIPLSALIILFLKCSNTSTVSFPEVGDDGIWKYPKIEGNQGSDQHLFYNATDDVMVTVI